MRLLLLATVAVFGTVGLSGCGSSSQTQSGGGAAAGPQEGAKAFQDSGNKGAKTRIPPPKAGQK